MTFKIVCDGCEQIIEGQVMAEMTEYRRECGQEIWNPVTPPEKSHLCGECWKKVVNGTLQTPEVEASSIDKAFT